MKLASRLAFVVLATGLTAAAQDPICANNPQAPQCLMNGRDSTGQPLNRWDNTRTVYSDKQAESDRENAVAARKAIDDLKNTPTGAAPSVRSNRTWDDVPVAQKVSNTYENSTPATKVGAARSQTQAQQLGATTVNINGGLLGMAVHKHQRTKYCQEHHGEAFTQTLSNGAVIAKGTCPQ
jgi:hypothetical protein